jgi:hypothetical protein
MRYGSAGPLSNRLLSLLSTAVRRTTLLCLNVSATARRAARLNPHRGGQCRLALGDDCDRATTRSQVAEGKISLFREMCSGRNGAGSSQLYGISEIVAPKLAWRWRFAPYRGSYNCPKDILISFPARTSRKVTKPNGRITALFHSPSEEFPFESALRCLRFLLETGFKSLWFSPEPRSLNCLSASL